jgi:amidase
MTPRVSREHCTYSFSRRHEPVLTVEPGAEVVLETRDCFDNQMPHEPDPAALEHVQPGRGNPATGPVFIAGAEPGMTLVAEVLDVTCEAQGILYATDRQTNLLWVRIPTMAEGQATFSEGLSFPLDPVVGVFGVAPSYGEVPNTTPGRHGGNLDCCEVKKGAKVYLPVGVSGALFGCGDIHALQADGEVCGMGIEVPGEVTVRLSLLPEIVAPWPIVETADHFAILTAAHSLDDAARQAVDAARTLLVTRGGYSDPDALMLQSLRCDLRVNQIVNPLSGARVCVPKGLLGRL